MEWIIQSYLTSCKYCTNIYSLPRQRSVVVPTSLLPPRRGIFGLFSQPGALCAAELSPSELAVCTAFIHTQHATGGKVALWCYAGKKYPVVMWRLEGLTGSVSPVCLSPSIPPAFFGKPLPKKAHSCTSPPKSLDLMGGIWVPSGVIEANKEGKAWTEILFNEILTHVT